MPKDLSEAALVVIEQLGFLVVLSADVHDDVAGLEDGGVSGPFETCRKRSERPRYCMRQMAAYLRSHRP